MQRRKALPQGVTLWRGPSLLDGKPVAAIATGFLRPSANKATGPLIQVWVVRSHLDPLKAAREGKDHSVCGDCPHRKGSCYVNVWREVRQVWRTYRQGGYPPVADRWHLFAGRDVRYTAYGDPAAVPTAVVRRVAGYARLVMGYTHQWATCDPTLKRWCMASVDSTEQREAALALGWRTFRVRAPGEPLLDDEFVCPKSKEAGHRLLCIQCKACKGGTYTGQHTPAILVHGLHALQTKFARDPKRFALPVLK